MNIASRDDCDRQSDITKMIFFLWGGGGGQTVVFLINTISLHRHRVLCVTYFHLQSFPHYTTQGIKFKLYSRYSQSENELETMVMICFINAQTDC